jgi:DNA polymerase I
MRLLVVDGTNAIMRRASVSPELTPEQAAKDALKRLLLNAKDLQATHCIVALDAATCWRYQTYDDYKGARTAPGEAVAPKYSLALGEAAEAAGLKVMAVADYEADDILASLAIRFDAPPARRECVLLSSDNDLLQLLALTNVHIYQYGKGALEQRTYEYVKEKFGIPPALYPDYLALVGGKNKVPGLPGVGPKRAVKLLEGGGLATLIPAGKIPDEHVEWMKTALKLHTLSTDAPIGPVDPKTCKLQLK